jgi:hypothetical protein
MAFTPVRTPIMVAATASTVAGRVAEHDLAGRVLQPAHALRQSREYRRADAGNSLSRLLNSRRPEISS